MIKVGKVAGGVPAGGSPVVERALPRSSREPKPKVPPMEKFVMEAELMEKRSRTASTSSLMHDPSSPLSAEEREKRRAEAVEAREKALEKELAEEDAKAESVAQAKLRRQQQRGEEDYAKLAEEDAKVESAAQSKLRRQQEQPGIYDVRVLFVSPLYVCCLFLISIHVSLPSL